MEAADRDLGRPGEVEILALELVRVRIRRRQPPGAIESLLAHEHGGQHGHEALRDEPIEREAIEREREERRVADPVAEARAGHARGALHVEAADLGVFAGGVGRRLARAAQLDRVLLLAFGGGLVGQVGDAVPDLLPLSLGGGQLRVEGLQLALQPPRLLDLLGRGGLAEPLLLGAHVVASRARVAPRGVGREQRVEQLGPRLGARARRGTRRDRRERRGGRSCP